MAISRKQKEELLTELIDKFKTAKSVVFTEYRGLTVKQVSDVRNQLRENGVGYKVAKKTLLSLAAEKAGFKPIPEEYMEGPISAVFSFEDEVTGPKLIDKLGKEYPGLSLKGGLMDGEPFGAQKARMLASIPSKPELIAQMLGSLQAPIRGFHGVLHGTMRKFVGTLQAICDKSQ